MNIVTIDGERFSNRRGFFREIKAALCPDAEMGYNLDALNDVLHGGYGAVPYGAPLTVVWKHADKSREDLGDTAMLNLIRVILADGMEHDVKLVLQTGEEAENTTICQEAPVLTIHGDRFSDKAGFYAEMASLLTEDGAMGRNLDALNDALRGGFGGVAYGQPVALCWMDFDKSRSDLGDALILSILTVMLSDGYGHDVHVILA